MDYLGSGHHFVVNVVLILLFSDLANNFDFWIVESHYSFFRIVKNNFDASMSNLKYGIYRNTANFQKF